VDVTRFVLSHLPTVPARVLEIGCGPGEVARAVAAAGYDVTAIDPAAPEGPIFRPLKLEDLEEDVRFDAIVAIRSLHHITDLDSALDKVVRLLEPPGRLVVEEFAWDRLDEPTAGWFHGQQRALAAAGRLERAPRTLHECRDEWEQEHVGLHGYEAMREALDARFAERHFEWTPYLHSLLNGVASEGLERSLIDGGVIAATGFRYVGAPRGD
jgi:ubiquinone/menaquinone biosynthesis C-methylase UbiE